MIREVKATQDAAALAAIYNEYVLGTTISFETEAITPEQMKARIAGFASEYPYLVYEEEGVVLGHCYAHRWKERAAYAHTWESTIYLSPQACGKGDILSCSLPQTKSTSAVCQSIKLLLP